jgi:hypothetical protein
MNVCGHRARVCLMSAHHAIETASDASVSRKTVADQSTRAGNTASTMPATSPWRRPNNRSATSMPAMATHAPSAAFVRRKDVVSMPTTMAMSVVMPRYALPAR